MTYRILATAAVLVALAAPAMADDVIRPSGPPLALKAGSGALIQASIPLGSVFIADPAVADVSVPTEGDRNLIYVFGKKTGKTALYALGNDGQVALSRVVDVAGPRTVRVLHGKQEQVWSEAHGEPTSTSASAGPAEIPPNTTTFIAVGSMPTTK